MAEGKEELWISAQDRDRLKVLHAVSWRHITQMQAVRELGVSSRWVLALLQRIKQEGDGGARIQSELGEVAEFVETPSLNVSHTFHLSFGVGAWRSSNAFSRGG